MGTSYSWGDWMLEDNFSQQEQSVIGKTFPGKRWIPQHWTLLRSVGQGAGLSYLDRAFAKEGWIR